MAKSGSLKTGRHGQELSTNGKTLMPPKKVKNPLTSISLAGGFSGNLEELDLALKLVPDN